MSGDGPASPTGRYMPLGKKSNTTNSIKSQGPGTGRGYQTRARLLTSKVSAPRPINLPSLRREHAGMETTSPVVLGTVVGWGSPSSSPASVSSPGKNGDTRVKPQSPIATADTNAVATQLRSPSTPMRMLQKENGGAHSPSISNSGVSQGSPKGSTMSPKVQPQPVARAWALPSAVVPSNGKSSDFPTAAETLDHLKVDDKKQQAVNNNPLSKQEESSIIDRKGSIGSHMEGKWDEMEDEALDFSAPVLEFADGTTMTVQQKTEDNDSDAPQEEETVTPADRFTDDYDRSYPSQSRQHHPPLFETGDARYSDRGHGYHRPHQDSSNRWRGSYDDKGPSEEDQSSRFDRRGSYDRHEGRPSSFYDRRDSTGRQSSFYHARGPSGDQWKESDNEPTWRKNSYQRRPSSDNREEFHPTLLQRPRRVSGVSARSDHSGQDVSTDVDHSATENITAPGEMDRPPEVTAVQKEVMLTAAERAKKRRDEEEAEYIAARERAKQKALELAKAADASGTVPSERSRQMSTTSDKSTSKPETTDTKKTSSSWAAVARPSNGKESGPPRTGSLHQDIHAPKSPDRQQKSVSISDIDKVMSSIRQTLNEKRSDSDDRQHSFSKPNSKIPSVDSTANAVTKQDDTAANVGVTKNEVTRTETKLLTTADGSETLVAAEEVKFTAEPATLTTTESTLQIQMITEPEMEHAPTWNTIANVIEPSTWKVDEYNSKELAPQAKTSEWRLENNDKRDKADKSKHKVEDTPSFKQWKQYMKESKEDGFEEKERSQPKDWSTYAQILQEESRETGKDTPVSETTNSTSLDWDESEASTERTDTSARGGHRGKGRGGFSSDTRGRGRGAAHFHISSESDRGRGGRGRGRGGRGGRFSRDTIIDTPESSSTVEEKLPTQLNSRADIASSWRRDPNSDEQPDIEVRLPHRQKQKKPKRDAESIAATANTDSKETADLTIARSISSSTRRIPKKVIDIEEELDFADILQSGVRSSNPPKRVPDNLKDAKTIIEKTIENIVQESATDESGSSGRQTPSKKRAQRKKSSLGEAKTPLFPQTFDNVVGKRPATIRFRFENDHDADKEMGFQPEISLAPSSASPGETIEQAPVERMNLVLTSTWGVSSPLSGSPSSSRQHDNALFSKELSTQIDLDTSALVDNLVHGSASEDADHSPSFKNRSKDVHSSSTLSHGQARFGKGQYGMGRRQDGQQQQRRVPIDPRMMGNTSFPVMMYPMAINSPAGGIPNNAVYVTSEQTGQFPGTPGQAQGSQQQPFYLIPQQQTYVSSNQFLQQPFNQPAATHSQSGNFFIPFAWQPNNNQQRGNARPPAPQSPQSGMEHNAGYSGHKNKDKSKFKTPEMMAKGLSGQYDKTTTSTWQYQPRGGPGPVPVPMNQAAMVAGPPNTYFNNAMPPTSSVYGARGGGGRGGYNMGRPTRGGNIGNNSRGGTGRGGHQSGYQSWR